MGTQPIFFSPPTTTTALPPPPKLSPKRAFMLSFGVSTFSDSHGDNKTMQIEQEETNEGAGCASPISQWDVFIPITLPCAYYQYFNYLQVTGVTPFPSTLKNKHPWLVFKGGHSLATPPPPPPPSKASHVCSFTRVVTPWKHHHHHHPRKRASVARFQNNLEFDRAIGLFHV
jgi:hypothetical protein